MDRNEILINLQTILRDVVEDENLVLTESLNASDVPGWDSLAHINLIGEIEKKFNIHFSMGEIVVLKNIKDLVDLIQTKLK